MKKYLKFTAPVLFLVMLLAPMSALAAPGEVHTNTGQTLNANACGSPSNALVDVNWTALNDYDSGVAGNAWANDTLNRHLTIWQTAGGFCARVDDNGSFVTFAGPSPLNPSVLIGAGIKGTIHGGYVGLITGGTFNPTIATRGNLGKMNYGCVNAYTCPNAFDWISTYVSGSTGFGQPYWAWNYQAGNNGSMVQQSNAPSYQGNITGN